MASARDHAAELLLTWDKTGGFVREPLTERRLTLTAARDRGLLTELVYGTIRRVGTLDAVLDRFSKRPVKQLNAGVRTALRLALYQALFLDRVPAHAAVDHAVGWARGGSGPKRAGFVNGVLRSALRDLVGRVTDAEDHERDVPRSDGTRLRFKRRIFPDPMVSETSSLAQRWSMPFWLVERWIKVYGTARTIEILRVSASRPGLGIRARGDVDALRNRLLERGLSPREGPLEGSLLLGGGEAGVLDEVEAGSAVIQDPTSQRPAPLCAPKPGQHILDLCAAPGGKTLHLADLMGTGTVTATDSDADKVKALATLKARMGKVALVTRHIQTDGPLPFEPGTFDAVLIDAPCTNTGVLRRRVEARWRLKPGDLKSLALVQRGLIERALPLVKPGGRLVYSTCSLEPEENEALIAAARAAHRGAKVENAFRALPGADHDGGFAAVFKL